MSAADIDRLARVAAMQNAKKKAPTASDVEREALQSMKEDWAEAFDLKAEFELDLKKRRVRIEFDPGAGCRGRRGCLRVD